MIRFNGSNHWITRYNYNNFVEEFYVVDPETKLYYTFNSFSKALRFFYSLPHYQHIPGDIKKDINFRAYIFKCMYRKLEDAYVLCNLPLDMCIPAVEYTALCKAKDSLTKKYFNKSTNCSK